MTEPTIMIPETIFAAFADLCSSDFSSTTEQMSCGEVEIIARLLFVGGREDAAAWLLIGHAPGDDRDDDKHSDLIAGWETTGIGTDEHVQLATAYARQHFSIINAEEGHQ